MEFTPPYPPTASHLRVAAMRAFIDGEALCDAGDVKAGVAKLKTANHLSWELDATEWPAWAHALYKQLLEDAPPPAPPPILARQPYLPLEARVDAAIADLASKHFCVIDNFLGAETSRRFRKSCETNWDSGELFFPAKVAGPGGSTTGSRSYLTRSDHIAWIDLAKEDLLRLKPIVDGIDELIRSIRPRMNPDAEVTRQRPQVARYGKGDAFARHCDNYCPLSGEGPHCNGRWLTAVYYTVEEWSEPDGGCLRLFRPQGDAANETGDVDDEAVAMQEDDAIVDVPPLEDRLILFHSDFRVPHEVRPVQSDLPRYAATVWYNSVGM